MPVVYHLDINNENLTDCMLSFDHSKYCRIANHRGGGQDELSYDSSKKFWNFTKRIPEIISKWIHVYWDVACDTD